MRKGEALAVFALLALFAVGARARARGSLNPQLDVSFPLPRSEWWQENMGIYDTRDETRDTEWWNVDDPVTVNAYDQRKSLSAFLWMIGAAETSVRAMQDGSAFRTFYRNTLFNDLSDHPVLTGEKTGVPLPDWMCRGAGYSPGCVSTAAGAFQITAPTWDSVRRAGAWGPRLDDFSPDSQLEAARRVMILAGALAPLEAGDFDGALARASTRWASLAGSTSGQRQHSPEWLASVYSDAWRLA